MSSERPEKVQRAQIQGDHEALSNFGRVGGKKGGAKGGIRAGLLNADKRAQEKAKLAERIQELAQTESIDEDGNVLPPIQQ